MRGWIARGSSTVMSAPRPERGVHEPERAPNSHPPGPDRAEDGVVAERERSGRCVKWIA
jgi:hypothetical protein